MTTVKRYSHGDWCGGEYPRCYATEDPEGDFVCFEDYQKLQEENAELKKESEEK